MAGENLGYKVLSGYVTGNLGTAVAVIAAQTGKVLSLKRLVISASAQANFEVENSTTATQILGLLYFAADGGCALDFAPGALVTESGRGFNIDSSTTDVATCYMEAYVLN